MSRRHNVGAKSFHQREVRPAHLCTLEFSDEVIEEQPICGGYMGNDYGCGGMALGMVGYSAERKNGV
jgi:hypothetical protein